MDASTRWETAAIRSSSRGAGRPPLPSAKRAASKTTWVTLREAEAATSVPVNTLRKWVRRADLPSYLESDGDIALRMVDLDAVVSRAEGLGRHIEPRDVSGSSDRRTDRNDTAAGAVPPTEQDSNTTRDDHAPGSDAPDGTMIVPIDAFNKMLSQLGNLHEAGQQLAEARERAARAETEATFLRQRLAELRSQPVTRDLPTEEDPSPGTDGPAVPPVDVEGSSSAREAPEKHTTTYWNYLTTGWAERRRLRGT